MDSQLEVTARLQLACEAGKEAGQVTLKYFRQSIEFERKDDDSPVTVADRAAETLIRQRIADAFPEDGIVGEEFSNKEGTSPYRWIIDPIDGTKSFISGVPLYGTMIGVEFEQRAVIGAVYFPGLDEVIFARQGGGAWHSVGNAAPAPAHVCTTAQLQQGTFVTSQIDTFAKRGADDVFQQLERAAYITRTWGDCYGYLLVATGRAVAMVDPAMSIWDAAALQPILEEAGGTFTDWNGRSTIHSGEGIATNGHVLEEVLAITRPYAKSTGS